MGIYQRRRESQGGEALPPNPEDMEESIKPKKSKKKKEKNQNPILSDSGSDGIKSKKSKKKKEKKGRRNSVSNGAMLAGIKRKDSVLSIESLEPKALDGSEDGKKGSKKFKATQEEEANGAMEMIFSGEGSANCGIPHCDPLEDQVAPRQGVPKGVNNNHADMGMLLLSIRSHRDAIHADIQRDLVDKARLEEVMDRIEDQLELVEERVKMRRVAYKEYEDTLAKTKLSYDRLMETAQHLQDALASHNQPC